MKIRLAQPDDDCRLRQLMRDTVIPGHIRMTYTREPDFFAGFAGTATETQVIVAEQGRRIVGVGCRSIQRLYVNGQAQSFGYLSGLRLLPEARNTPALARGYAFLKTLDSDGRCPGYLTTIVEGNRRAAAMLASGRAGLPCYMPAGTCLTHAFPLPRHARSGSPPKGLKLVSGAAVPLTDLGRFWATEGARRQYFPVAADANTGGGPDILASLGRENLAVALRAGAVVGTMGLWDQQSAKQCRVDGYSRLLRLARPVLNLGLRIMGCHALPPPGESLRLGVAALVCIANHEPTVFRHLLKAVVCKAVGKDMHQLVLGMHERDPLLAAMPRMPRVTYRSRLFLVSWNRGGIDALAGSDRIPHLEIGTL